MRAVAILLIVFGLLALGVACQMSVWSECRDRGHSIAYCFQLVNR